MHRSFHAFMHRLIDYAGLFPPAQLPFTEAIRNFLEYQKTDESWVLSRFICPISRLVEIRPFEEVIGKSPLPLSLLGKGGTTIDLFLKSLEEDLKTLLHIQTESAVKLSPDLFEVKLPPGCETDTQGWKKGLQTAGEMLKEFHLTPFYEGPAGVIDLLTELQPTGFKIRCGGVLASSFPSPADLAQSISRCLAHSVPVKFTAGLHHPIRHFDKTIPSMSHGFLNVFGAGILAFTHKLPAREIQRILEDEEPKSFRFEGTKFFWTDLGASTSEIESARKGFVTSYGSCSFNEPRDDLNKLYNNPFKA